LAVCRRRINFGLTIRADWWYGRFIHWLTVDSSHNGKEENQAAQFHNIKPMIVAREIHFNKAPIT